MSDVERLARMIERVSGNVIPEGQYPYLEKVALERVRESGLARLTAYLDMLEAKEMAPEWRLLLPRVTINESYLFRIPEHFRALREEILPALTHDRNPSEPLRVWSAGCACGEEPSTIAMVLAESPYLKDRRWQILATDVDGQALEAAQRGEFGERAVARVPSHLLRCFFSERKGIYSLDPELQNHIEYRQFNLIKDPLSYFDPPFDLIFLRNVLIYFRPELQRQVIARIAPRLTRDGFLFLGHSESLWQLSDQMNLVELGECFAYQRVGTTELTALGQTGSQPSPRAGRPTLRLNRKTTGRGTGPKRATSLRAAPPAPADRRRAGPPALAPSAAGERPRTSAGGGSSTIDLRTVLDHLSGDRLEKAHDLVAQALESNKGDAEAHALHGLIHDLEGRNHDAVEAYRAALYLEDGLFQVRFLLAGRLERLGSTARARREYRNVLSMLESGRGLILGFEFPELLPTRQQAIDRSRRALERLLP